MQLDAGTDSANPVARLLVVAEAIAKQDENTNVATVWARVFKLDPADLDGLLRRLADLLKLAHDARKTVEGLVDDADRKLHLDTFDGMSRVLSRLNFEAGSQQLIREVRALLQGLRYTAHFVRRLADSGAFDAETLSHLQAQIDEMIQEVLNSSVSADLKQLLVARLEDVRDAIIDVRLRGPENLEAALDALWGTSARNHEELKQERAVFDGIRTVLKRGFDILVMAGKLAPLAPPAVRLLSATTEPASLVE